MDPAYLTTKEVADLLRVRERKVYDMVATGEIPHRKITGKLLFPQGELTAWIEGEGALRPTMRPDLVTGSHDPLLDWALRESGAGLATLWNGTPFKKHPTRNLGSPVVDAVREWLRDRCIFCP